MQSTWTKTSLIFTAGMYVGAIVFAAGYAGAEQLDRYLSRRKTELHFLSTVSKDLAKLTPPRVVKGDRLDRLPVSVRIEDRRDPLAELFLEAMTLVVN